MTGFQPQHAGQMFAGLFRQQQDFPGKQRGGDMDAGNAHGAPLGNGPGILGNWRGRGKPALFWRFLAVGLGSGFL